MPNFEITSPDGTKYQVTAPEGATEADALARVKAQHDVSTSAPDVTLKPGNPNYYDSGDRMTAGEVDPFAKAGQVMAHVLPQPALDAINWVRHNVTGAKGDISPESVDAGLKQREANIQASRGGDTGIDVPRLAGNVMATLPLAAAGPGAGAGLAARAGAGAAQGAVSGALQPVTDGGDLATETAKQAGFGAAAGAALPVAGSAIKSMIAPNLRPAAELLANEGVQLTPGQLAGHTASAVESKATSVPLAGDQIAKAQRTSIETFNRAAINRTLAPINETLPPNLMAGNEAVAHAGDAISAVYDRVLPQAQLNIDVPLARDIASLQSLTTYMPPDQERQFARILQDRVVGRLIGTGGMDGETLQQVQSELRNFARAYAKSTDAAQRQLGDAVGTLNLHLDDAVARQNPTLAPQIDAANQAWAMLVRVEDAAGRRATSQGVFTPGDLLASIKKNSPSVRARQFARGDALMQDLGSAAQEVIGNTYPNSGTAGRIAQMNLPSLAVGAAAGVPAAAIYNRPMANALAGYARPGATRNTLARVAGGTLNRLAPFGSLLAR